MFGDGRLGQAELPGQVDDPGLPADSHSGQAAERLAQALLQHQKMRAARHCEQRHVHSPIITRHRALIHRESSSTLATPTISARIWVRPRRRCTA
jgi:hypothetical protein